MHRGTNDDLPLSAVPISPVERMRRTRSTATRKMVEIQCSDVSFTLVEFGGVRTGTLVMSKAFE